MKMVHRGSLLLAALVTCNGKSIHQNKTGFLTATNDFLRGVDRQLEGEQNAELSTAWSTEESDEADFWTSEEGGSFTPAQPIEFFKDGMDSSVFEWVNKEEVMADSTTCGFLHPELGSFPSENEVFPRIKVYFCMHFAEIQPAPKGNLIVHCGGPGLLSDCIDTMGGSSNLGEDNRKNYNIISVDQRGMGRSEPSFAHEQCTFGKTVQPDGNVTWNSPEDSIDPYNETNIYEFLQMTKQRVINCWTCETCGFQLTANQKDGSEKTYHFLEYSGTRQLAEDIDLFRRTIDAPKLSLYGASYGTAVMGTYATIFPRHVDKFIIDSNVLPESELHSMAAEKAAGTDFRINYLIYSCSARNILEAGSCPVEDMKVCINDVDTTFKNNVASFKDRKQDMSVILKTLFIFQDHAKDICDAAASNDFEKIRDIVEELNESTDADGGQRRLEEDEPSPSKPSNAFGNVIGHHDYAKIMTNGEDTSTGEYLVQAQDYIGSSSSFDEDAFIKEAKAIAEQYDGAGTGRPGTLFIAINSGSFYWPKVNPLPPRGSPMVEGIVSGQIYDSLTPFIWTLRMRNGFKSATLLSAQSTEHGLAFGDFECQKHLIEYLQTGVIEFLDGHTCGSPLGSVCKMLDSFNAGDIC